MSDDVPNAILRGGPAERMPDHQRIRSVNDPSTTKIKVLVGNRYEHFVAVPRDADRRGDDGELRVFA